jgi:hypothetical protein
MEDRKNAGREVRKNDGAMQRAHKQLKNTRAGQRNRVHWHSPEEDVISFMDASTM